MTFLCFSLTYSYLCQRRREKTFAKKGVSTILITKVWKTYSTRIEQQTPILVIWSDCIVSAILRHISRYGVSSSFVQGIFQSPVIDELISPYLSCILTSKSRCLWGWLAKRKKMDDSLTFGQKIYRYARTHTLRRLFVYAWLAGALLGLIANVADNAMTEVLCLFVGVGAYFCVTVMHGFDDYSKAKNIALIHIAAVAAIIFASMVVADKDVLYSYIVNYDGEDSNPLSTFLFGIWAIETNTMGKIILYLALCVMFYTFYEALSKGERRYRYIPITLFISYGAFFLFCLLSTTYSFLVSDAGKYLLVLFLLLPGIMAIIVLFREGKSSIPEATGKTSKPKEEYIVHQVASTPTTTNAHSPMAQKLIQLKALLDSGVLTQEEFDAEKKKILNN